MIAAIAAWRATHHTQEAMIRAAAEQREEARDRRLRRIDHAYGLLCELESLALSGNLHVPRSLEIQFRLRGACQVLTRAGYETKALFEVVNSPDWVNKTLIGEAIQELEGSLGEEFPLIAHVRPENWRQAVWWWLRRRGPWTIEARVTKERERWTPTGRRRQAASRPQDVEKRSETTGDAE